MERLVSENPKLPKLSRQKIVDILHNITSKELAKVKNKETFEKTRDAYQRALYVVLPYNANNSDEDLKDLYTKPPIVHLEQELVTPATTVAPKVLTTISQTDSIIELNNWKETTDLMPEDEDLPTSVWL